MSKKKTSKNQGHAVDPSSSKPKRPSKSTKKKRGRALRSKSSKSKSLSKSKCRPLSLFNRAKELHAKATALRAKADEREVEAKILERSAKDKQANLEAAFQQVFVDLDTTMDALQLHMKPGHPCSKEMERLRLAVKNGTASVLRITHFARQLNHALPACLHDMGSWEDPIVINEDESDGSKVDDSAESLAASGVGEPAVLLKSVVRRRRHLGQNELEDHEDPVWGPMITATRHQAAVWLATRHKSKLPRSPNVHYSPADQVKASDLVMSGAFPASSEERPIDNSHLLHVKTHLHVAKPQLKRERSYGSGSLDGDMTDSEEDEDEDDEEPVHKKRRTQYFIAEPVTNNLLWDVD